MNKRHSETWAERMEQLENHFFVGRQDELKAIGNWYSDSFTTTPVLNLFGLAGSGKSLLLHMAKKRAHSQGIAFHVLDCRSMLNVTDLKHELQKLDLRDRDNSTTTVVCFDHYEESGLWETWLRENWLPSLSTRIRLILSSRSELQGPWKLHPTLKYLVSPLSLTMLDYAAVEQFAARHGLTNVSQVHGLWVASKGHPLTLSLATEVVLNSGTPANVFTSSSWHDVFAEWLREVPDDATRELLEAASVLRFFDQSKLEFVLGQSISTSSLESILRLSLVDRNRDGWNVHNPIRDAVRLSLRARNPERFEKWEMRAALFYQQKLMNPSAEIRLSNPLGDLLYHTGNPVIRAHYHCSRTSTNTLIQVRNVENDEYLGELFAYIRKRKRHARSQSIWCGENDQGHLFQYEMTKEQSLYSLLDEEEALELIANGADVKLLLDEYGSTVGCCALIPIRTATKPYLQHHRLASIYFNGLTEEEWSQLLKAEGWYIRTIDIENPENEALRHDSFRIKLSLIQAGSVIVYCPPPLPFYEDATLNLGFTAVDPYRHALYGESAPAPFYKLDLRGKKYRDFISALVPWEVPKRQMMLDANEEELTRKEAEVAELLIQGLANAEIAKQLFVSVITVKKHLSSIYHKWNVRNRAQFMTKWMDRRHSTS
ncbi:LuxR C-terminal-related transcriptional regulator [Paenibacillus sedimenti]|nr:LuxR C-terminal-related transcriptional regulator [Paenibacillus sedimenti]